MKINQYKNERSKKRNKISVEGFSLSRKEINGTASHNKV